MRRTSHVCRQSGGLLLVAGIVLVIVVTAAMATVHHDRQRLQDLCAGLARGTPLATVMRSVEALPGVRTRTVNQDARLLLIHYTPLVPSGTACEVQHDGLAVLGTRMTGKP
jgi:hypothetical protein